MTNKLFHHSVHGAMCLLVSVCTTTGCELESCPLTGCIDPGGSTTEGPNTPEDYGRYKIQCLNGNSNLGDSEGIEEAEFNWYTDALGFYHTPYLPYSDFGLIDTCVDYVDEPTGGFEEAAREACSLDCESLASFAFQCDNDKWTQVRMGGGGSEWQECPPGVTDLDIDLIEDELGAIAAIEALDLPCDLAFTCGAYLTSAELAGLKTGPHANVAATAEIAAETVTPGASAVAFGTGDTAVTGEAAYSAKTCSADACPFYLAQFDLAHSGSWSTDITVPPSDTITKLVSSLEISLRRPGLGIWLPNSGFVIFPPGSLMLEMNATIGGLTNTYSENGTHHGMFTNRGYAFGQVTFGLGSSTLVLGMGGTDYLGNWRVQGDFATP